MNHFEIRAVGEHCGAPRVWLEGRLPEKGGFLPGVKYSAKAIPEKGTVVLEVVKDGVRVVSGKERDGKVKPIIDLNSKELLGVFDQLKQVRVIVQDGKIFIMPIASEVRAKRRIDRLKTTLASGQAIKTGSVASGIGVLDYAAHEGLESAGLETSLAFANEIREDCTNHAVLKNPIYGDRTVTLTAPLQELAFDEWAMGQLPEVDFLIGGLPCSGASVAGRAKRKLAHPEDHPDVGHLVAPFIAVIAKVNPACLMGNRTYIGSHAPANAVLH